MAKFYAGIGSRETPSHILDLMTRIARKLDSLQYTLRSGGADGADTAFANGAQDKVIYLPWRGFNRLQGHVLGHDAAAESIACRFHPRWACLSQGAQKLHTRNVYQILGHDLKTPVEFVVCWTKDGQASGGTGQAIRIAQAYNIPVKNLHSKELCNKFEDWLKD